MNTVFADYASYYDLLYKDKDYHAEANFIVDLIRSQSPDAKTLLNLGCGTGRHDQYFSKANLEVTGVDLSGEMVSIAKKNSNRNREYFHADARTFKSSKKFDVIIALFHVFSYQTDNDDVFAFLNTIKNHLNPSGVAIFDYWYGPAVLSIKPENRVRHLESEALKVVRYAKTDLDFMKNIATVNFKVEILEKKTQSLTTLNEKHPMRYFFTPELELFLENSKLKTVQHMAWPQKNIVPSDSSWVAYHIVKPISP